MGKATLALLYQMEQILRQLQPLTVRGVAYRLFILKLIDSMEKKNTARVSRLLKEGRERGLIAWPWIVDETADPEIVLTWPDLNQRLRYAARSYRKDHWQLQPRRIEVWSEKGTVRGVLRPVLDEFEVTFRVFHGFAHTTTTHDIAEQTQALGVPFIVFYVGDWDPSGLWMSQMDLPRRLALYGGVVDLRRVALVASDLPSLPGFDVEDKREDPRYEWFKSLAGDECWELDAMDPNVLRQRVRDAIVAEIDWPMWDRCSRAEQAEQDSLRALAEGYEPPPEALEWATP
jgi:hypothetical protein